MSAALIGCASVSPVSRKSSNTRVWESAYMKIDLIGVNTKDSPTSEFDQFYAIRFKDNPSVYHIPSFLDRIETSESFSRTLQSFGGSSLHFSPSGKTVVIDDDTPGAASSDGHKLIVGTIRDGPIVATVVGPERPGVLIEDWPSVTSVSDTEVIFRYDNDKQGFSISVDTLLRDSKRIARVSDANE
jgi:hypothetical protein